MYDPGLEDDRTVLSAGAVSALKEYYKHSEGYRQHLVAKGDSYFSRYAAVVCSITHPLNLILDVGCGSGTSTRVIAAHGRRVVGTDISSLFLSTGQERTCAFAAADAAQLPFSSEMFDLVGAIEFIEHVWPVEPVLREMARVLKPSGKIVLASPNLLSPLWPLRDFPAMVLRRKFRPPHYSNFSEACRFFLSSLSSSMRKLGSGRPHFLPRQPELALADSGGDFDAVYLAHPRDIILCLRSLGFTAAYAKPDRSLRARAAALFGDIWGSFMLIATKGPPR